ncbi:MAG: ribosome biogenesis GTPase YlqF [Clostridia bacterium]|nr:ribosome biogenesis GTPase YlqF [Clostridia bacterium]
MQINWYPGHMAKARRMLIENLKLIDVVVEIADARVPRASRNPDFDELFAQKKRVVLLNKSDLADPKLTKRWINWLASEGIAAAEISAVSQQGRQKALSLIEGAAKEQVERLKQKGVNKTVRVLVVGIPNVGKSTFINQIAGSKRANTGDKPGVTKGKQWVKITPHLELMDSPGLLWPKLEDEKLALNLAFIGSINDEILDVEDLAHKLLCVIRQRDSAALYSRYSAISKDTPESELLEAVCKSRGFLLSGGVYDSERAARIVLDEFRGGKIAKLTLDLPGQERI